MKDGRDPQEAHLLAGARPGDPGFGEDPAERWGWLHVGGSPPTRVPTIRGDYRQFYAGLRDAVRGEAEPPVDPVDAIRGLRVLEAAEASARSGSVVAVTET